MIKRRNEMVTSSKEIKIFETFYTDLYTSTCTTSTEEVDTLFASLQLPTINEEQRNGLDAPITEEEISILSLFYP